jgi:putative flippase GtrA
MAERAGRLWQSQALSARLARFALVGGLTSGVYALVVAGLVPFMPEPAAAAVAYLVLLPVNFIGHRRATFRSRAPTGPELARYLAVHGITLTACAGVMALVTSVFGASHWAGSALIVVLAPVLNFVLLDRWVFRRGPDDGG